MHLLAHARHDAHVDDDVGRIGDLDADLADGRIQRAHREGNHIHRAALHAALEQSEQLLLHLDGIGPMIRRPGFVLGLRADERPVLHARHVAGMRAGQIRAGALLFIELDERAALDHQVAQHLVLGVRAVAPEDFLRLAERRHFVDPGNQFLIGCSWFVHVACPSLC